MAVPMMLVGAWATTDVAVANGVLVGAPAAGVGVGSCAAICSASAAA
jgi:hypothetical protein